MKTFLIDLTGCELNNPNISNVWVRKNLNNICYMFLEIVRNLKHKKTIGKLRMSTNKENNSNNNNENNNNTNNGNKQHTWAYRKSLQLLRSAFPDHMYLNEQHNVTLGVYMNKGGSNQSLYRLKEDEQHIIVVPRLIDSLGKDITQSQLKWSIKRVVDSKSEDDKNVKGSNDFSISVANITFCIVFHQVPSNQPIHFQFQTKDHSKEIQSFVTLPFRVW
ncbi:hypothetical protein RFI_12531 [Reticulomyxa filosa]|uniref:Uncharacterized protein n=1 Tax=Reticulomyxa filosa TaxID=46433 RepID=X6NE73_RETFI|nr:hypothetical protein RFI_12531 [Reticulomyxa filosa]|eukprot:ETO24625.1 hypothetical protein RFI_12531 [Reticulomyxa filosa]